MSDYDELLSQYTAKGSGKIHGVIAKCVDKNGKQIYSKVAGYDSIAPDARPLNEDAALKVGSATKFITSIALLQCVEQGLIGLDDPVEGVLPELAGKPILTGQTEGDEEDGFTYTPSTTKITPRHLLTHTSGLGYYFLGPLNAAWSSGTPEGRRNRASKLVHERFDMPLLFEPGGGWLYGSGLEWAGALVRRLHGGVSLTDYLVEHVWKRVGLTAPFPTFNLADRPEYEANRMMGASRRQDGGGLDPFEFTFGHNPVDQEGGAGMVARARDFLAVLADLVSDAPRLLKPETVDMVFAPQLPPNSKLTDMLAELRPAWDNVSGSVASDRVNHGLAGMLLEGPAEELGQPGNLLAWGGALNTVWFASRELGVAGFFSTQVSPFADGEANRLINAWKRDFWSGFNRGGADTK